MLVTYDYLQYKRHLSNSNCQYLNQNSSRNLVTTNYHPDKWVAYLTEVTWTLVLVKAL